jgi:outer membrane lipoprotein-sorting protein
MTLQMARLLSKPDLNPLVLLVPKLLLRLCSGFAAVFLVLVLSACAAPESISASAAQTALTSAWQADQHTVWEIEWPAAPVGGPLTVETWRAGPAYRYEILEATAPDLVGQTLIFNGQTAWRYNRFELSQSAPQSGEARLSPVTDAFAVVVRLMAAEAETATQEAIHLSSGPTQKMTLTFANGDSLSLWRDEASGLPVRVTFTLAGQSATLHARSFEPLSDPPEELFRAE